MNKAKKMRPAQIAVTAQITPESRFHWAPSISNAPKKEMTSAEQGTKMSQPKNERGPCNDFFQMLLGSSFINLFRWWGEPPSSQLCSISENQRRLAVKKLLKIRLDRVSPHQL